MTQMDINEQMEIYRNNLYRRRRLRFYGLILLVIVLSSILLGLFAISKQPIDRTNIDNATSTIEAVNMEYGTYYLDDVKELPSMGYMTYYGAVKEEYLSALDNDESTGAKDKKALDLLVFVEYVQEDAEDTAYRYASSRASKDFYKANAEYLKENGELITYLKELLEGHQTDNGSVDEERLDAVLKTLDERMDFYTKYLKSLKNV